MKQLFLPRFSSYAQFAEWVQSKNLTLFSVGQFVMWVLRFFKRHSAVSAFGLVILSTLVFMPFLIPQFESYGSYFWAASGLLMLSVIWIMGVSFGILYCSRTNNNFNKL